MPIIKPARTAPAAPAQHKQPSRKGKKAWRKNVDVTEVQQGLVDLQDEILKGYGAHKAMIIIRTNNLFTEV